MKLVYWLIPLVIGAIPFVFVLLRKRNGNLYRVDPKRYSHLSAQQQSILQTWLNVCLMNGWKPGGYEFDDVCMFTALDGTTLIKSHCKPSCADIHGTLVGNIQRDQAN